MSPYAFKNTSLYIFEGTLPNSFQRYGTFQFSNPRRKRGSIQVTAPPRDFICEDIAALCVPSRQGLPAFAMSHAAAAEQAGKIECCDAMRWWWLLQLYHLCKDLLKLGRFRLIKIDFRSFR